MREQNRLETDYSNITDEQVCQIRKLAEDIRFGTITLVFQDGILIQLERNEKIRILKKKRGTK